MSPGLNHAPAQRLALAYAPRGARPALAALFALDAALAGALRLGRDPMVRELRLTWWYEALQRLDHAPPPSEPLLQALAAAVLPAGVRGAELAALSDGWDVLLNPDPLSSAGLLAYAEGRGALFPLAARLLGAAGEGLARQGQGWALAELAAHASDPQEAAAARALALPLLARRPRWPRALRPLAMLAALAALEARAPQAGPLRRLGALLGAAWL